jgi:uncharacterized membrane protein YidH (DUF202 family)
MSRTVGLVIIMLGVAAVVIGLLVWAGAFNWFGRLPGDIRTDRVFIPITSMIVVSVVLSVLLTVIGRWLSP